MGDDAVLCMRTHVVISHSASHYIRVILINAQVVQKMVFTGAHRFYILDSGGKPSAVGRVHSH